MYSKKNFIKREPSQQIIFRKLFERFIGDLKKLPYVIIENTNIRYQFNIIVHFSKYTFNYLLENKESDNILDCIKDCFKNNGLSQELGTDNGKEFCNRKLKNYLDSNKVKFI